MSLGNIEGMKTLKDWIVSQLALPLLAALRLNFGNDTIRYQDSSDYRSHSEGASNLSNFIPPPESTNACVSPNTMQEDPQETPVEGHFDQSRKNYANKSEMECLTINFLRLVTRLGLPLDDYMVSKVLYRLHLATLIRGPDSVVERVNLESNRCKKIAIEQENSRAPEEVDFSVKVLLIGKSGVGKSATINSIFGQTKTRTDAFEPATKQIREITGTLHGIKITLIDTPGLLPFSACNVRENRKILLSIKRHIRNSRSPPDLVLYLERLDLLIGGFSDFDLLQLVTDVFGTAIWFNTIVVMTHSSSDLPEGPSGHAVSYESYSSHCKDLLRHYIHRAISDPRLQNEVLMVENHRDTGEKILPSGEAWKSRVLLSCICSKVLSDANTLLKFHGSLEIGSRVRGQSSPSLPNLLSSFLRRSYPEMLFETDDGDDEYDELPPIRVLSKHQFEKLSKSHKEAYLDELEYRERLYLKKQMKERDVERHEAVLLPDMVVPESFDSDCPVHRYRCLITSDKWVVRPVLDPHGWDHDVGFDGVNIDLSADSKRRIRACATGQMSKDKRDTHVQSRCFVAYHDPQHTCSLGLDAQSSGEDIIYTTHSSFRMKGFLGNDFGCGISATPVRGKYYVGAKVEDVITVGKRVKFELNAGRMVGLEEVGCGGSVGATLCGKDYTVSNESLDLAMTVLSFDRELVFGGSFRSEFHPCRGMQVSVNADINSRKTGRICVKIMGSGCAELALLAVFSIFKFLLKKEIQQATGGE